VGSGVEVLTAVGAALGGAVTVALAGAGADEPLGEYVQGGTLGAELPQPAAIIVTMTHAPNHRRDNHDFPAISSSM
jgi:hypothetical protein